MSEEAIKKPPAFLTVTEEGALSANFNPAQGRMLQCQKRRVVFCGGTRSGKTASGIFWLYMTMRKMGPGDYMVVAPTMSILSKGAELEIRKVFERYLGLGEFRSYPRRFIISDDGHKQLFKGTEWEDKPGVLPTVIYLIHATDPNALEAITAKACWADEAGQDTFKVESYEAIERRLSIDLGPMLITTTPYNMGWLKRRLVNPWMEAQKDGIEHPIIEVIKAKSIENPAFPVEEYWRQKEVMPFWRWDMMYNANFSIPSGLVYDCVPDLESEIKVEPFEIPDFWPRYVGVDFGGVNFAALFAALDPSTGLIYIYRAYHPGKAMAKKSHAQNLREKPRVEGKTIIEKEPYIDRFNGGAGGESDERDEFLPHGVFKSKPKISSVEAGIGRTYGILASGRVKVFDITEQGNANDPNSNRLSEFWDEIYDYRYETDEETGLPLPAQKIVNQNKYHILDCARYLSDMFPEAQGKFIAQGLSQTQMIPEPETTPALVDGVRKVNAEVIRVKDYSRSPVGMRVPGPPPSSFGFHRNVRQGRM